MAPEAIGAVFCQNKCLGHRISHNAEVDHHTGTPSLILPSLRRCRTGPSGPTGSP